MSLRFKCKWQNFNEHSNNLGGSEDDKRRICPGRLLAEVSGNRIDFRSFAIRMFLLFTHATKFIEHQLCARHCVRCWGCSGEADSISTSRNFKSVIWWICRDRPAFVCSGQPPRWLGWRHTWRILPLPPQELIPGPCPCGWNSHFTHVWVKALKPPSLKIVMITLITVVDLYQALTMCQAL